MPRVTFIDDIPTYSSQNPERQSPAPLAVPRPMRPQEAQANSQRAPPPTDRPSIVPSIRPTRADDHYVPAAPAFTPPSKLGSTVPTDDPMKSGTSQPLPQIPTSLKKAEPFSPKPTASQSVRYISSIAQMLPSPEPRTADIPRSNETGMITVHNDICCGNEDCIVYPVTTWPSSVLAYDDEMLYKELPATEPPFSSLTIEAPDYSFVFEVAASYADFVTVLDVLEAIYQNRNHFDKRWFHGRHSADH